MIIFDIYTQSLSCHFDITLVVDLKEYFFEDMDGFHCFQLTIASATYEGKKEKRRVNKRIYGQEFRPSTVIYQLFVLTKEKLGVVYGAEFEITHNSTGIKMQLIGTKQIFFSKACISDYDWNEVKKSIAIPFFDVSGQIKGCQFILKRNKHKFTLINLLDQNRNNLFTYESDIFFIGYKKFNLIKNDENHYLTVISSRIKSNIIKKQLLD